MTAHRQKLAHGHTFDKDIHFIGNLFANHDLHHNLVAVVAQGLHLTLHIVRDVLRPLRNLVGVVHLASELLVQSRMNYLLKRIQDILAKQVAALVFL